MRMQKLSQEINQIRMPEEMKTRIMSHCYSELERQKENSCYGKKKLQRVNACYSELERQKKSHCYSELEVQNRNRGYTEMEKKNMRKQNKIFRKPMAAAMMAACFCMIGVTALASGGKLEGFFKDIVRLDGAVVGTSYEQATDEIKVNGSLEEEQLIVEIEFVEPGMAPYSFFETFKIGKYEIVDTNGKLVAEGDESGDAEIRNGKVELTLSITELSSGNYKLVIREFVGGAKAEQPLVISGTWECEFTR